MPSLRLRPSIPCAVPEGHVGSNRARFMKSNTFIRPTSAFSLFGWPISSFYITINAYLLHMAYGVRNLYPNVRKNSQIRSRPVATFRAKWKRKRAITADSSVNTGDKCLD